jgi:hypothetical protein
MSHLPIAITKRIPLDAHGIFSTVAISNPANPHGARVLANAMWDTGASISVISSAVCERLGLNSYGEMLLDGAFAAAHTSKTKVLVSVCIDGMEILTPAAICEEKLSVRTPPDLVLGLDFISKGDFAISHDNDGYPIFSFTYPSHCGAIDVVDIANHLNLKVASTEYSNDETLKKGEQLLKLQREMENTRARRRLEHWACRVIVCYLLFVFVLILLNGASQIVFPHVFVNHGFISDTVMTVVLSTTTINIIGLGVIVLKGHFKTPVQ